MAIRNSRTLLILVSTGSISSRRIFAETNFERIFRLTYEMPNISNAYFGLN